MIFNCIEAYTLTSMYKNLNPHHLEKQLYPIYRWMPIKFQIENVEGRSLRNIWQTKYMVHLLHTGVWNQHIAYHGGRVRIINDLPSQDLSRLEPGKHTANALLSQSRATMFGVKVPYLHLTNGCFLRIFYEWYRLNLPSCYFSKSEWIRQYVSESIYVCSFTLSYMWVNECMYM